MNKKGMMVLKALIDRSPHQKTLLDYFEKESAERLHTLPYSPLFSLPSLLKQTYSIEELHYSWYPPLLQTIPPEKIALFLSLFDKNTANKIQKLLNLSVTIPSLPPFLHPFLARHLKEMLEPKELLPISCLPESELLPLLSLSKEQLLQLIDFLGIYDLAADLRQVVDKSLLSAIAAALTLEQRKFLQYASKQSLRYLPKKMNLQEFRNDKKALHRILHQRGLQRLAHALVDENTDFLWHLYHKLDKGRASLLEKMGQEKIDDGLVKFFKRQVSTVAKRILL